MDNTRKAYRLPDTALETIAAVRQERELPSDTAALCYIIEHHRRQRIMVLTERERDGIAEQVVRKLKASYGNTLDQIRLASSMTEKNTVLTLDAINSMLHDSNTNMMMRANGPTMHRVIRESEKRYQARLERNAIVQGNSYPEIDRRKE